MSATNVVEVQPLRPTSAAYEKIRTRFFNGIVPDIKPAEIYCPHTTAEVAAIVADASRRKLKVGVRSGGHSFSCPPLVQDGILIDVKGLNKEFGYDPATKVTTMSPGHTVQDVTTYLRNINRFFPAGHSRSVGIGGFYLSGGQGCFLRGWGYTCDGWITQIEVVTPKGDIVIANKETNADLFWAAPGSGQGFFGVLTRLWARTIPARKLYDMTYIVDTTDIFKRLMKWVILTGYKIPKYGSDLMAVTFYADQEDPAGDDDTKVHKVLMAINQTLFADSLDEAKTMATPWYDLPQEFGQYLLHTEKMKERTWEELWDTQDRFLPRQEGLRFKADSILIDPQASEEDIVEHITPAMYDLPTRLSTCFFCPLDYYPNEADTVLSLPQKSTITTTAAWKDPSKDRKIREHMLKAYMKAEHVACGQYVPDFDVSQRITKVFTPSAFKKWLTVREKWDPEETFVGYKPFLSKP